MRVWHVNQCLWAGRPCRRRGAHLQLWLAAGHTHSPLEQRYSDTRLFCICVCMCACLYKRTQAGKQPQTTHKYTFHVLSLCMFMLWVVICHLLYFIVGGWKWTKTNIQADRQPSIWLSRTARGRVAAGLVKCHPIPSLFQPILDPQHIPLWSRHQWVKYYHYTSLALLFPHRYHAEPRQCLHIACFVNDTQWKKIYIN